MKTDEQLRKEIFECQKQEELTQEHLDYINKFCTNVVEDLKDTQPICEKI